MIEGPDPVARATGLDLATFAETYWARRPLLCRAADLPGDGFADLIDLGDVDELISRRGLRTPFLRMAKEGDVLGSGRFTRGGGAGAEISDQAADDKVLSEFAAGATLVLQGLHRMWPPVIDYASALSTQLGHPVQVNAYVTPSQNTGFAPHYDVHDVFVLQFAGRKRWRIHEPVLTAPLREQTWDARRDVVAARAAEEPLLDVVLEPGDALYLPRGYVHTASALGEVSGHLTIGVQPVTRAYLAEQLLGTLGDDPELRVSLPAGVDLTDPAVLETDLKATRGALHAAIDRLSDEQVARSLRGHLERRTRPVPISPIAQVAAAAALDAADVVRLRPGLRCELSPMGDRLALRAIDRTTTLPAGLEPALARLLGGDRVRVADLPGLEEADALTLIRRLLREGIVVSDPS
ncbi:MAG: cupin domain-containing protein [Dermatophilaceae bacterium]